MRIDTHTWPTGRMPVGDAARAGHKGERVFGVDATLHGMTAERNILLTEQEFFSCRHTNLLLHQINSSDELRHRMLNLNARVHFDEIKLAILIQKLKRTGTAIFDLAAGLGTTFTDLFNQFAIDPRCGRLFDHFLMTALHRAVALTKPHRVFSTVRQHLDFNVTGVFKKLFEIDLWIIKRRTSFRFGHSDRIEQSRLGVYDAHAASATTACRFDNDGITDLAGRTQNLVRVIRQGACRTRHNGHTSLDHGLFGAHLVAHQTNRLRPWTDEHKTAFFYSIGEVGVFRQKTVPWVDGFGISDLSGRNNGRHIQIAIARRWRANADRLVR